MSLAVEAERLRYIDPLIIQRLLKIGDFAIICAGAVLYFTVALIDPGPYKSAVSGFVAIEAAFISLLVLRGLGLYKIKSLLSPLRSLVSSLVATAILCLTIHSAAEYFEFQLQSEFTSLWLVMCASYFVMSRAAAGIWAKPLAEQGVFRQRIAIVGGGAAAEAAIARLEASSDVEADIVGIFDDRDDTRSPKAVRRYAKIGTIADLADFARHQRIDLIIVAIPLAAEARLLQLLRRIWELPVDIRISGESSRLKLSPGAYTYMGKLPLLSVFDRPLSSWSGFTKDCFDRVIALVMIIALAPVMLLVALAIKLESRGPVLFRQKRYGFNNELIEVFKFRSMYTDMCDATASRLVTKGDPRVTRVGRVIRKTSLDELPQLFNVLSGRLSLVGPRPHATQAKAADKLYEQVVDGYFARHKVKPGITGWAQINGWRGETDTRAKIENRVKFDLEYIDRWSLLFDVVILARTPLALVSRNNAANAF